MATPEPENTGAFWLALAAVGAVIVCCAGPLLAILLATTGLGLVAARPGAFLAVATAALIAGLVIAGVIWRRRRACAGPAVPGRPQRGRSQGAHDGDALRT